jgi:hypothetical protein
MDLYEQNIHFLPYHLLFQTQMETLKAVLKSGGIRTEFTSDSSMAKPSFLPNSYHTKTVGSQKSIPAMDMK